MVNTLYQLYFFSGPLSCLQGAETTLHHDLEGGAVRLAVRLPLLNTHLENLVCAEV